MIMAKLSEGGEAMRIIMGREMEGRLGEVNNMGGASRPQSSPRHAPSEP